MFPGEPQYGWRPSAADKTVDQGQQRHHLSGRPGADGCVGHTWSGRLTSRYIRTALAAAGATPHDIIKLFYYVVPSVDPSLRTAIRGIRDQYVNTATPPASTLGGRRGLGSAGLADRDRGARGDRRLTRHLMLRTPR